MSHEGKMRRGAMYQNSKDLADNIKEDVAYFLDKSKPKEKPIQPVAKIKPKEKKE